MSRDKRVDEVRTYRVSLEDKEGREVEAFEVRGRPVTPFAQGFQRAELHPDNELVVRVERVA